MLPRKKIGAKDVLRQIHWYNYMSGTYIESYRDQFKRQEEKIVFQNYRTNIIGVFSLLFIWIDKQGRNGWKVQKFMKTEGYFCLKKKLLVGHINLTYQISIYKNQNPLTQ